MLAMHRNPPKKGADLYTDLREKLKVDLRGRRTIFTVTTGRSGTGYLAKILSLVPEVASHHEPEPSFAEVMRAAQQDNRIARKFWIEQKLPQLLKNDKLIYSETSHLFCKGFVEPLIELGITPDLIILTREHREVARSLYRLNTIPGLSPMGLKYLLSPADPDVLPLPGWKDLSDYQLCFWYCLEIERRSHYYANLLRASGARVAKVNLNNITNASGFIQLLGSLNLPKLGPLDWLQYFLLYRRRRINQKLGTRNPTSLPANIDELEEEVISIIN